MNASHTLPQRNFRYQRWTELDHASHIAWLIILSFAETCVPVPFHVITYTLIVAKPRLVGDIFVESEGKATTLCIINTPHRSGERGVKGSRSISRVDIKIYVLLLLPGRILIRRIRRIERRFLNFHTVDSIPLYSKRRKLRQIDVAYISKARKAVIEMTDEREGEPERREVWKKIDALEANVVLDCIFDDEWVVRWRDREAFVSIGKDQRGETSGEKRARVGDRHDYD